MSNRPPTMLELLRERGTVTWTGVHEIIDEQRAEVCDMAGPESCRALCERIKEQLPVGVSVEVTWDRDDPDGCPRFTVKIDAGGDARTWRMV